MQHKKRISGSKKCDSPKEEFRRWNEGEDDHCWYPEEGRDRGKAVLFEKYTKKELFWANSYTIWINKRWKHNGLAIKKYTTRTPFGQMQNYEQGRKQLKRKQHFIQNPILHSEYCSQKSA